MKKVIGKASGYIFAAFGVAVLGLLMTLTYQALQRIFPTSFSNQIWGLVLFDIAALCWAIAFVFKSETTTQYAVAAIGFIVGFLGTLGMVAAEVMLSGQRLVETDAARIGQWIVYGFIGTTALHAALLYAHHAGGAEIHGQIEVGIARGEIVTEARKQATRALDEGKAELAHVLTQDIVAQVKRDLGLTPVTGTPFEPKKAETPALTLPTPTPQPQDEPQAAKVPFPSDGEPKPETT